MSNMQEILVFILASWLKSLIAFNYSNQTNMEVFLFPHGYMPQRKTKGDDINPDEYYFILLMLNHSILRTWTPDFRTLKECIPTDTKDI